MHDIAVLLSQLSNVQVRRHVQCEVDPYSVVYNYILASSNIAHRLAHLPKIKNK